MPVMTAADAELRRARERLAETREVHRLHGVNPDEFRAHADAPRAR